MRIAFAAVAVVVTGACGCAAPRVPLVLSPLGSQHVREHYRYQPSGSAIVLPLLDCTAEEPDLVVNVAARQSSATRFSDALWQALALPGEPLEGLVPESADLCKELSDNHQSGANIDTASPVMRERLRDYFGRNPSRVWLVAFTRTLKLGQRVPGPGPGVGALAGQVLEGDDLEVSAYVFTVRGDVAYRADLSCSPGSREPEHDCGSDYSLASERLTELLEGFPRPILQGALLIQPVPRLGLPAVTARPAPRPRPADPAVEAAVEPEPRAAVRPAHRGKHSRHRHSTRKARPH